MKYITAYIRCEDCPSRICLHGQNCPYESTKNNYSVDSNDRASKDCSYKYVLQFKTITSPTINLKSGEYDTEQTIKVTAPSGCKIYYTTDGTTPTKKSKLYKNSIKMPKGNNVYYFVIKRSRVLRKVVLAYL